MFNSVTEEILWGGETLKLETGKIARQADGCVIATKGETRVMAAVTFAKSSKPGQDFFPLKFTTKKDITRPERYLADFSSGKRGRPKRKR